ATPACPGCSRSTSCCATMRPAASGNTSTFSAERFMNSKRLIAGLIVAALCAHPAQGQTRPVAAIAPSVETDAARAGSSTRVALTVTLPEGLHIQSNNPRDPSLIAATLTIDAPPGVRVAHLVFPEAKDFTLNGQAEPLAV